MKIFLTGGTGFVGSHIVREAVARGHSVVGLARSDNSAKQLESLGATPLRGSLESLHVLAQGAKEADAVIHCGYIHDFTDMRGVPAKTDLAVIKTLAESLIGTPKPLIITSIYLNTGHSTETDPNPSYAPRGEAENLALSYTAQGVRAIIVRLPSVVHGIGEKAFVPILFNRAAKSGFSAYIGDGSNHWSAVHVKDAARLYLLAIEKDLSAGTRLHATDGSYPFIYIAEVVGKKVGVPAKSIEKEKAMEQFGFVEMVVPVDSRPSCVMTKEMTGWEIREVGMMESLKEDYYKAGMAALD